MIDISVEFEIKKASRQLTAVQKKQLPFAIAVALTKTAVDSRKKLEKQTVKDLDRPTKFTQKAFAIKPAKKRNLVATVFIKPIQAKYLGFQIFGGTRQPRAKSEAIPFNVKLNKFGNIPGRHKGKIQKLLARPDTFIGTVRGISGLWQRGHISKKGKFTTLGKSRSTGISLLIAFEKNVRYKKRFRFVETVEKEVKRVFTRRLRIELARAIKTAR